MKILENDPKSRHPASATTKENIDRVNHMLMDDKLLTINQIVNAIKHIL